MVCTPEWHWKHQTKEYCSGRMYIYDVCVQQVCNTPYKVNFLLSFFPNLWHCLYNPKSWGHAMIRSRDSKEKSFYTTKLLTSKAKSTAWVWTLWASSRETCSKAFSVSVPFSMVTSAKDFIHCIHGYSSSQLWPEEKIYETS